jgi:hypothetical protein
VSARLDTCASCDALRLLNCDRNVAIVSSGNALVGLVSLVGSACIVVDVGVSVGVSAAPDCVRSAIDRPG